MIMRQASSKVWLPEPNDAPANHMVRRSVQRRLETCLCPIISTDMERQKIASLKVLHSIMNHQTRSSLLTCLPAVSKKKYVSMPKQATSSHTIAASIKPRPGTKPNSFRTPSPETRRGGKTESLRGEVKMKSTGAW